MPRAHDAGRWWLKAAGTKLADGAEATAVLPWRRWRGTWWRRRRCPPDPRLSARSGGWRQLATTTCRRRRRQRPVALGDGLGRIWMPAAIGDDGGCVVTAAPAAVGRRQRGGCRVNWQRWWKPWHWAASYSVVEGNDAVAVLRRRWLASMAVAMAAVTLEAVATSGAGKESGAR
ncbi:hypothetical protein OsI_18357 [Oryza sativa Indica Group]|uniref:Uncharacterized protein n=1 Tax=Oryza sativa subsp. indica TaxID=39946 RepID=B8AXN4_ORYSI|nr:hypothetical protein OsI_18357 [Oryza sativa Indica Group]